MVIMRIKKSYRYLLSFAVITLMCSVFHTAYGQMNVPDNDKIAATIADATSPYYYPALMLRYQAGDTTLTAQDYHYLYYGYAFQDKYQPLEPIIWTDDIYAVFERGDTLDREGAVEILSLAKRVMDQDPFSPSNINYMTYAYAILGDTLNERISADRFSKIAATIEASGSGLTEKSPWHVLWFSHAADIMTIRGYEAVRRNIISRSVEYVRVAPNDDNVKGFYVDYSRLYWKRPETKPEVNSGSGFLLNGIKLKK